MIVGERIPSPYYERIISKQQNYPHVRKCYNCGLQWDTVEIYIAQVSTEKGEHPAKCPLHPNGQAHPKWIVPVWVIAKRGNLWSKGLMRVAQYGGVYRRRFCGDCPLKWTTGEFSSDGLVVADIATCIRCGAHTKLFRGKVNVRH